MHTYNIVICRKSTYNRKYSIIFVLQSRRGMRGLNCYASARRVQILGFSFCDSSAIINSRGRLLMRMPHFKETYRSGHNELDSKSSCPQGHEGSNPSVSALKKRQPAVGCLFCLIILFCLHGVSLSLSCHLIALEILIVCGDLVDELSSRHDLHDAVRCGLYDLMVS